MCAVTPGDPDQGVTANDGASPTVNTPKTRLVIKEMVLENFKSYAGAQRVGPFHKVCLRDNLGWLVDAEGKLLD